MFDFTCSFERDITHSNVLQILSFYGYRKLLTPATRAAPLSENSVGSGFFYHRTLVPRLRNRTGSSVNLQKRKKNKRKRKKKVVKTIL